MASPDPAPFIHFPRNGRANSLTYHLTFHHTFSSTVLRWKNVLSGGDIADLNHRGDIGEIGNIAENFITVRAHRSLEGF